MFDIKKFNNNLSKYNSNADIQKQIARKLIELLYKIRKNFDNILEIGCGTGFLTGEIFNNFKYDNLYLNDIVETSKNYVEKYSDNFFCGDAEKIIFPENLDLIISSSVFQWLNDFENFSIKTKNSLNTGGIFAFSMFINNNFREIREKLNISLHYLSNDEIIEILKKDYKILIFEEKIEVLNFKNSIDILRHIEKTGVNIIKKEKLTKNRIYDFINSNILNLTYNYNFIIAEKK